MRGPSLTGELGASGIYLLLVVKGDVDDEMSGYIAL